MNKLNPEEQQVLYLIETDTDYSNYFFARARSLNYFSPLKEKGYFLPEKIPFDANGNAQFWNVLDYLERVTAQVKDNPEYGKELIEIFESLVQFSLQKKRVNNYHIWWYCAKILNNLPVDNIKANLTVDQFKFWLNEWASVHGVIEEMGGGKLLPKFLNEDSSIKYAETIIDVITKIKTPNQPLMRSMREEPVMVSDAYWVLESFKNNREKIGLKCSLDAICGVADRLKLALEFARKTYAIICDVGNEVYQVRISKIPAEGLREGEIAFKAGHYECVIGQYSQEQLNETNEENRLWVLHNAVPQTEIQRFPFAATKKGAFIAGMKAGLSSGIDWAAAKNPIDHEIFYDALHHDYSEIAFKSLAHGEREEHGGDAQRVLTTVFRDVLLAKCEANRGEGRQLLETLMTDCYPFPLFKRFVLLCVDKFWADYADLLDGLFDLFPNILHESAFEVELWDIFENHNADFSPSLKEKLDQLINDVPEYYLEKDERVAAFWKFKWLSPLRTNPEFKTLYEEVKQKIHPKDDKPYEPERSAFKGGWVIPTSPLSADKIMEIPIAELIGRLNEFEGADFWQGAFEGEPTKDGLADALQSAVKQQPKHFTDGIDAFASANYFYLHRVIQGLKEARNANKENNEIDWEAIFNFATKYFGRGKEVLLKDAAKGQGVDYVDGNHIWIVNEFVDLIADGCKDDARAYDPKLFDVTDQLFDLIIPLLKGEKHPDTQRDALTYTINTSLGRTILSYLSFSLRQARITKKKIDGWGGRKYERFYAIGIDADILFGWYLPQIMYLDKQYAKEKIEMYTKKESSVAEWQMFMEGYLGGARVHGEIYKLMRPNYAKGVEGKAFEERTDQKLVEHVSIGYLQFDELLQEKNSDEQDSLFWKMLLEAGTLDARGRWLEVVRFFWSISGRTTRNKEGSGEAGLPQNIMNKVLLFWKWTYEEQGKVQSILGDKYNSLLGRLAELTIFLEKIDDETEKWLLLSAPHIDRHHNAMFFIEYLAQFDDVESIRRIGRIYKEVLKNSTPTFDQEHITLIVDRIYKNDQKEDGDEICNTYGRRGIHFLKPIYDKYQNN